MKLRIGDKVRILNEVGEGIVSRIKDDKNVFVEMQDGFEIPFQTNQLVAIHNELIVGKDTENIELHPDVHITDALYFVIEPDHEFASLINDYKIYLFNASSFNVLYTYSIKDDEYFQTIKHGEAGAYQKVLLRQVKLAFFKDYAYHKLECVLFKNSFFKAQWPVSETLHITPYVLEKSSLIRHEEFKYPVYGFLLKDEFMRLQVIEKELRPEDIEKIKSLKEFKSRAKISKSTREHLKSLEKEIDLHIHELIENTNGLSNFEMLNIQLETVERELDAAIQKHMKKLVFIHGVGNGRLKQELLSILKSTKGISYHDASFKEYGYGATQVNIL